MNGRGGGTTETVTKGVTDVGHIFGQGGTDGLILYALLIGSFFLFIISIVLLVVVFRYLARAQKATADAFAVKDAVNAEQTKLFIASADRTAQAINNFTATLATDVQERSAHGIVLARVEGTDRRLETLLNRLNDVQWERVGARVRT